MRSVRKIASLSLLIGGAALATVFFVPPVRNKFFTTKLWPWPLPWDTTAEELSLLRELSKPGDVIIESNLHSWQWIALCLATTRTSWVHAALVDENKRLITVDKEVVEADFDIYLRWGSTRLGLIRPPYANAEQAKEAIAFARSKLGRCYDPSFQDHSGNCNGLVGSSLVHAGIAVPQKQLFGKSIYAPDCFFQIANASRVWISDTAR